MSGSDYKSVCVTWGDTDVFIVEASVVVAMGEEGEAAEEEDRERREAVFYALLILVRRSCPPSSY